MAANFDNSAWFYDRLAGLVYGGALIRAQVFLVQFVPATANVLIVGGGTGWILEKLAKVHPSGLNITYVEVSSKMMARSQQRNWGDNHVTFINNAIENVCLPDGFDLVIAPFLLDNFTEPTLQTVFCHIVSQLKPGAVWLIADFQLTGKWWQQVLLKAMFVFFRITCDIEASTLPDIGSKFRDNGYNLLCEKTFFGQFIISRVYQLL